MSDQFLALALEGLLHYGPPVFALSVFLRALGTPLPSTVVVVAVGAFARQGYISLALFLSVGLLAVVAGNIISYGIGRFGEQWLPERLIASAGWQKANGLFQRHGGLAIFFSRFTFTLLSTPMNLIAGSLRYSFVRFVGYTIPGELLWLLIYSGLGYWAGSQWAYLSQRFDTFGTWVGGSILLIALLYWMYQRRQINTGVQP